MILQNGKRIDGCSDTVPVGTLQPYLGLVPPKGYLVCQGQLVSKITYKELYEICGDTFGTATTTHFYLPDLRGKTLAGYDENDTAMNTIGKLLGQKTHTHTTGNHTLTVAEMPKHEHSVYADAWAGKLAVKMTQREQTSDDGNTYDVADFGHDTSSMSGPLYATEAGGSQAHNHGNTGSSTNYQPTITVNWVVKAVMLIPNYIIVENRLDSDSTVDALSAAQGKYLNDKFADYVTHSELEEFAPSQGGVMEGDVTITGRLHVGTNNANTTDTWIPVIGTNGVYEHTQREFASSVRSTHFGTNGDYLPTLDFLSFWNGAYDDSGHSNITYCNHGAIGTMATKGTGDYISVNGGTLSSNAIKKAGSSYSWCTIRDSSETALISITSYSGYQPILRQKTPSGVWGMGAYTSDVHITYFADGTTHNNATQLLELGYNGNTIRSGGAYVPHVWVQSGQPSAKQTGDIWFVV